MKNIINKFLAITIIVLVFIRSSYSVNTIVRIQQGVLKGNLRHDIKNGTFYAFRSIPYGEPPIGRLRFMPPVPHKGWKGIYDATKDMPTCYQASLGSGSQSGQEDCLRLNVFTKNINPNILVPVMIFFHGGLYMQGGANEINNNANYLLTQDIVLVTVSYRLGILGFCSFLPANNYHVTSNAGLKDQNLAMRWVNHNIKHFGGDPLNVVLVGQSAGGASAMLHMMSPLSQGLFSKVIAQSGSIFNGWALGQPGSCELLAREFKIASTNPGNIVVALQEKNIIELLSLQSQALGGISVHEPPYYGPVIEGPSSSSFLPFDPKLQLSKGRCMQVPMFVGYNDKEGIILDTYNVRFKTFADIYNITELIPYDLNINNDAVRLQQVGDYIKNFYFKESVPLISERSVDMINLITDSWFAYGIMKSARMFAKYTDVYFYRFSKDTSLNFFKKTTPETAKYAGASHSDELGYLFQSNLAPVIQPHSAEETAIEEMVSLWVNFSRRSDSISSLCPKIDPTSTDLDYLAITNIGLARAVNPDHDRMTFWDAIYNEFDPSKAWRYSQSNILYYVSILVIILL